MIKNNNLGAIMGAPVIGKGDERIGTVGQIFVDPVTDVPNWATVHTGLFGRRESFVPLRDAEWDHERLHLDIDKDTVKGAPRIDTDEALSPEDEENLYRYYSLGDDAPNDAGDRGSEHTGERSGEYEAERAVESERAAETVRAGRLKRYQATTDGDEHDEGSPRHAKTD